VFFFLLWSLDLLMLIHNKSQRPGAVYIKMFRDLLVRFIESLVQCAARYY
jgi:hypothetical protein